MVDRLRVLVIGAGGMGLSHARAYRSIDGFEIVGFVSRSIHRRTDIPAMFSNVSRYDDYKLALADTSPDAVAVCTYPETHAEIALAALESGAHVFVEKPLADNVQDAQRVVDTARKKGRILVVGFILRHHPSWVEFIRTSRMLGKPLVMRMNLVQQSSSSAWITHRNMLRAGLQPIVDCGIHYVDVMCQMTQSKAVSVHAIGARLSDEVDIYNYGQLQIRFDDDSVGWYEAAYGPSFSETAYFIKDVVGPKGSVSIVNAAEQASRAEPQTISKSANVDSHTDAQALLIHRSELDRDLNFARKDELVVLESAPDHDELCRREQEFFLDAIRTRADLTEHMETSVATLKIVLAADESSRTGKSVDLV